MCGSHNMLASCKNPTKVPLKKFITMGLWSYSYRNFLFIIKKLYKERKDYKNLDNKSFSIKEEQTENITA